MSGHTLGKLVYMANQIATAFRSQGADPAHATYDHIWHFWDPRMRAMICDHAKTGGDGLNPIAVAAIDKLIHGHGEPSPDTRATEFSNARDKDLLSDAG